jgi:hypothetical protein
MKKISILILLFLSPYLAVADEGIVVNRISGCDYFIADGPSGLYVLEWYGGYDPGEGDIIEGNINSYGFKEVIYNGSRSGKVYVEDFLESNSAAWDEINDHCN